MKLKHACVDAGQYGLNVSPDMYCSAGTRMIRTSDLSDKGLTSPEDGVFLDLVPDVAQELWPNDILLSRAGTIGRSYLVQQEAAGATFAGFLVRFRPRPDHDARFLSYAIKSAVVQQQIVADAITSTISNFNADRYANLEIPQLSLNEQRRIADFLDERVALIDQIIAARRAQEELLTVSGVTIVDQCLARLPDKIRASRVTRVLPGFAFPSADFVRDASEIPLLRGVNVGVGSLRWDDTVYWPSDRRTEVRRFELHEGDVVMGMDRPWIGSGLRIARVEGRVRPLLLQRVAKFEPTDAVSADFLYWAYQGSPFRAGVESELTGLSVPHLSGDQILGYQMPFGDRQQQDEVVADLERLATAVGDGRSLLENSVRLLQEYKQSLITAAVTGELDVTTASTRIPENLA